MAGGGGGGGVGGREFLVASPWHRPVLGLHVAMPQACVYMLNIPYSYE